MNYPFDPIEKVLTTLTIEIVLQEKFQSKQYWFLSELWELRKFNKKQYLNFLKDPDFAAFPDRIWAISITNKKPSSRIEAENGTLFPIDKNLITNLKVFLKNWQ